MSETTAWCLVVYVAVSLFAFAGALLDWWNDRDDAGNRDAFTLTHMVLPWAWPAVLGFAALFLATHAVVYAFSRFRQLIGPAPTEETAGTPRAPSPHQEHDRP